MLAQQTSLHIFQSHHSKMNHGTSLPVHFNTQAEQSERLSRPSPYSSPIFFSKSRQVRLPQSQLEEQERARQHKKQLAEKLLLRKQGLQATPIKPSIEDSRVRMESIPRGHVQQLEHLTSYVAPTLADSGWAFSSVVYYPSYQLYAVYQ